MDNPALPGLQPSPGEVAPRGRGRPKGSKNKRSLDLGRYIEAFYGGMTPGQQAAAIGMVTPKDLRTAKRAQRDEPERYKGLDLVVVAMAVKAKALARALGCTTKEAWDAMRAERSEVMPYVHQRMPQAVDLTSEGKRMAMVPIIAVADLGASGAEVLDLGSGDYEEIQGLEPVAVG